MPKTCIVAEADSFIAQLLCRFAEQNGFFVAFARTGQDLLHLIATGKPDLLILDVELPGETRGWEALQILRDTSQADGMAVISCSWLPEPDARRLAGSAAGHLQKPDLRYADFLKALRRAGLRVDKPAHSRTASGERP